MSAQISSVDAELIDSLENAVARHAGSDGLINLPHLQQALGLKNEQVARRVLRAIDTVDTVDTVDSRASGLIDSQAFLASVRALVEGGERKRLEFAFRLHDDDDDGSISEPEMLRMIAISTAQSAAVTRTSQAPDQLARALFRAADHNHDGRLSFDEFARAMRKHPQLLRQITESEARWIAPQLQQPNQVTAKAALPKQPQQARRSPLRALDNHRYDLLALTAWLSVNIALFAYGMGHSQTGAGVPGASWLRLARGFAACLSLNTALLILPVMRHLVARLRRTWWGRKLDVDNAIEAHRVLGHVLLGVAWAQGIATVLAYQAGHRTFGVARFLTRNYHGSLGALLLLVLSVLWAVSWKSRRSAHNVDRFYTTHGMFGVLVAMLALHAPSFLAWTALPIVGLGFELISRQTKRSRQALLHELTPLDAGVTRLTIERPAAFRFEAGNYIFINLPDIAKHEWHPFTVSSPPEQSDLTVYARSLSSWTLALRKAAAARQARGDNTPWLARIDGPHGSSSAKIFHTRNAVLIGAGNGIVPLASVLHSIVARASGHSSAASALQHVQVFWLNRDQGSYEWLASQLSELERVPVSIQISVHTCLTSGRTGSTSTALAIARELNRQEDQRDPAKRLRTKTHTGHPDWRIVLTAIADQYAPEPVEVFFCGPPGLGVQLQGHCEYIGMRFHEEKL